MDLNMMTFFGSRERTIDEMRGHHQESGSEA